MTKLKKVIKGLECCRAQLSSPLCEECPYKDDVQGTCDTLNNIFSDALELLKEQEPRVLTHEEADAIAHQTEETAIYLERKSDKSLYAAIAGDTQGRVPNISWLGKERNYQDEYGISWRCWSARPTDEQREAVKWDE